MSPILFKIYIHRALTEWYGKYEQTGLKHEGKCHVHNFLFAGDQVVILEECRMLFTLGENLEEECEKWALKLH
jgi:hypothetical protein